MQRGGAYLVIGADGLIGGALASRLAGAGRTVLRTTRRREAVSRTRIFLDLAADVSEWEPPRRISVACLCAGISAVEYCHKNPAESAVVNVKNTVALAEKLVADGTHVIFLSTNLVFDGTVPFRKAEEPVCPVTEYGRQKAKAEEKLHALGGSVTVIRLTKVLSPDTPLFVKWVRALRSGSVIHPFSDMVMAPVPLSFVVDVLERVSQTRLPGILQVSGPKDVTYAQVAYRIAQLVGASPGLVQPIRWRESGLQLEAVPLYSTLDTTRLRAELGMQPPEVWPTIDLLFGNFKKS